MHLFFDCDFATQCLQIAGLSFDMSAVEYASDWLLDKLSTETHENLVTIATVLWSIWYARNKLTWENLKLSPSVVAEQGRKQVAEWTEVWKKKQMTNAKKGRVHEQLETRWTPPSTGSIKINVDASVFAWRNSYSIGMVARDQTEAFLKGKTMRFEGAVSVMEAESIGVLEAIGWSEDFADQHVIVETDSLLVVKALKEPGRFKLELGHIIDQCRYLLGRRSNLSVVFVRNQANKVAHKMARLPCLLNSYNTVMSPPSFLLETISFDASFEL